MTIVMRGSLAEALCDARAQRARARSAAAISRQAPLVRPEGSEDRMRRGSPTAPTSATATARCCWPRSKSRHGGRHSALAAAAGDSSGRTSRRPRCRNRLALARVRRGRRVGLADRRLRAARLRPSASSTACAAARQFETDDGDASLRADRRASANCSTLPPDAEVNWLSAEQSNSSLTVGDRADAEDVSPHLRRPASRSRDGPLSDGAGFANTPPLLGDVVRIEPDGTPHTLAIALGLSAIRATPGLDARPADARARQLGTGRGGNGGRSRSARGLRRRRRGDRPPAWRDARHAGATRPTIGAFAPETADRRRRRALGGRRPKSGSTKAFDAHRHAQQNWEREQDRERAEALLSDARRDCRSGPRSRQMRAPAR